MWKQSWQRRVGPYNLGHSRKHCVLCVCLSWSCTSAKLSRTALPHVCHAHQVSFVAHAHKGAIRRLVVEIHQKDHSCPARCYIRGHDIGLSASRGSCCILAILPQRGSARHGCAATGPFLERTWEAIRAQQSFGIPLYHHEAE